MHKSIPEMLLGVLQWTIAILSVAGTLALLGWIISMLVKKDPKMTPIDTVRKELDRYEHPLFEFSAQDTAKGVELCIRSRIKEVHSPEYRIVFADRDLSSTQFPWTFQKLLYDCLTDYMVELFTKSPMTGNQ